MPTGDTQIKLSQKPTVALTLGDPAGIGPELMAKLLVRRDIVERAKVVLVGDAWLWEEGQAIAGVSVATRKVDGFDQVGSLPEGSPFFLPVESARKVEVPRSTSSAASGASVLKVLSMCLDAAAAGQIDAICFAPLNKYSMKIAGMQFPDELHFFADYLKVSSHLGEFNTLGNLWTARISSHVPMEANALGYPVTGPFPADTVFLKARDGHFDGVVTMYHDQGQIAVKLLGFERGVTIQGGLPIPITTSAHGSAFDIAGQNKANVEATVQAFLIACRMGTFHRTSRAGRAAP